MIRKLLVGAVELVVVLLALYAFFFLPLGRRTPYGHLEAIFATAPAQEAVDDVKTAGKQIVEKVRQ